MTEEQLAPVSTLDLAIQLDRISKMYGTTMALAGASFDVKKGEIFGLLGPNGAGKTTTIRILKGMIKATSGNAYVLGKSIAEDPNWIKQHTGYLPEEGSLLGRLTPLELSEFLGGLYGVSAENARTRATELLKLFGLHEKRDELIEKLSRGMKQKLSIISSIIHDPDILLMDEPLASLDPSAAKMVKDFITFLSREKAKTIIISSHRLSLVEDVCDRVAILHKGQILEIGTPEEIMRETKTTTLEDAYLAIIQTVEGAVMLKNGKLVEKEKQEKPEDFESEQTEG